MVPLHPQQDRDAVVVRLPADALDPGAGSVVAGRSDAGTGGRCAVASHRGVSGRRRLSMLTRALATSPRAAVSARRAQSQSPAHDFTSWRTFSLGSEQRSWIPGGAKPGAGRGAGGQVVAGWWVMKAAAGLALVFVAVAAVAVGAEPGSRTPGVVEPPSAANPVRQGNTQSTRPGSVDGTSSSVKPA